VTHRVILRLALLHVLAAGAAAGPEEDGSASPDASLSGPTSVRGQIGADSATRREVRAAVIERVLESWYAFKDRVNEDVGLSFGFDYNALFMVATEGPGGTTAAGGAARLFGDWQLVGRGTPDVGSFVFKGENRHRLGTPIPPKELGLAVGYDGLTAYAFNDRGWLLTNCYWHQQLASGRLAFVAGIVDVTDYVDVYGLGNPWTDFSNGAFGTDPTIAAPNQGLGAAAGYRFTEHLYALGGIADANGDPTDPADCFRSFFDTREYFTHLEFGWIAGWEQRTTDNVHLTLWHADARPQAGTASGWGVAVSWSRRFPSRWEPFVRAGYADDGGALWDYSLSAGCGYALEGLRSFVGVGVNWGRPSEEAFGPGLDDQYTLEAYFRFQATKTTAVTPNFQLLIQPASNPGADVIAVFGIRVRFNF